MSRTKKITTGLIMALLMWVGLVIGTALGHADDDWVTHTSHEQTVNNYCERP